MCIFTRRDNFYVHAVSSMPPTTQFSCDITLWIYFRFPETNFFFKDLEIQIFYTVDYDSSSGLSDGKVHKSSICAHIPENRTKCSAKNHILLLLNICGPLYQAMTSVPDHDPALDSPMSLIP